MAAVAAARQLYFDSQSAISRREYLFFRAYGCQSKKVGMM